MTRSNTIRLLAMGGTIAFEASDRDASPTLGASDLSLGVASGGYHIDAVDVASTSSIAHRGDDLLRLLQHVREAAEEGYLGVVITHGTDTMEETAYFLALTCPRTIPIVLTGAMRPGGSNDSDGPRNLRHAMAVASLPAASGFGPLVVMNDGIHTARFVAKIHPTMVDAFGSPSVGPVGQLIESRPHLWLRPTYDDFVGIPAGTSLPCVELVTMSVAGSAHVLDAVVGTNPDGLVIAGFGGGHVAPHYLEGLQVALGLGLPIVVSSRCSGATTLTDTYGVPGTELDLLRRGVLLAGGLSTLKARLRLMVALACGVAPAQVFPVD
jgi:L-asparaginase